MAITLGFWWFHHDTSSHTEERCPYCGYDYFWTGATWDYDAQIEYEKRKDYEVRSGYFRPQPPDTHKWWMAGNEKRR
jgi:hypothetical protein